MTDQDRMHRRGGLAQRPANPVRPHPMPLPEGNDRLLAGGRQPPRAGMRPTPTVGQAAAMRGLGIAVSQRIPALLSSDEFGSGGRRMLRVKCHGRARLHGGRWSGARWSSAEPCRGLNFNCEIEARWICSNEVRIPDYAPSGTGRCGRQSRRTQPYPAPSTAGGQAIPPSTAFGLHGKVPWRGWDRNALGVGRPGGGAEAVEDMHRWAAVARSHPAMAHWPRSHDATAGTDRARGCEVLAVRAFRHRR